MRITVGGVLLFCGAAAFAAMGPMQSLMDGSKMAPLDSLQKPIELITSYFKKGEIELPVPVETNPVESVVTPAEAPASAPPPIEPIPAPEALPNPASQPAPVPAAQAPAPVPVAAAPEPAPVKLSQSQRVAVASRKHRIKKRPPKRKGNVLTNAAEPKAAVPVKPGKEDSLVGSYVALKLKNGREVKGVLQEKNAKQYMLEIPGMGPFPYPADNVVSVSPAQ